MNRPNASNYFLDLLTNPEALTMVLNSKWLKVALTKEKPQESTNDLNLILPQSIKFRFDQEKDELLIYADPVTWTAVQTTGPFQYVVFYHAALHKVLFWYDTKEPIVLLCPLCPGDAGETFTWFAADENNNPVPALILKIE